MTGQRSCVTRDPEKSEVCCYLFSYESFRFYFTSAYLTACAIVNLQVQSKPCCCNFLRSVLRLMPNISGAHHHSFKHGFFYGNNDHFVYVVGLHFPEITEIFLKTFLDDILNIVFAHADSVGTKCEDLCELWSFMPPAYVWRAHIVTARPARAANEKMHRLLPAECHNLRSGSSADEIFHHLPVI